MHPNSQRVLRFAVAGLFLIIVVAALIKRWYGVDPEYYKLAAMTLMIAWLFYRGHLSLRKRNSKGNDK